MKEPFSTLCSKENFQAIKDRRSAKQLGPPSTPLSF